MVTDMSLVSVRSYFSMAADKSVADLSARIHHGSSYYVIPNPQVPPFVPHKEINASTDQELCCVLVRNGPDPIVVNMDIDPAAEAPETVWVGSNHPKQ